MIGAKAHAFPALKAQKRCPPNVLRAMVKYGKNRKKIIKNNNFLTFTKLNIPLFINFQCIISILIFLIN